LLTAGARHRRLTPSHSTYRNAFLEFTLHRARHRSTSARFKYRVRPWNLIRLARPTPCSSAKRGANIVPLAALVAFIAGRKPKRTDGTSDGLPDRLSSTRECCLRRLKRHFDFRRLTSRTPNSIDRHPIKLANRNLKNNLPRKTQLTSPEFCLRMQLLTGCLFPVQPVLISAGHSDNRLEF
jgi:hypothetical protein